MKQCILSLLQIYMTGTTCIVCKQTKKKGDSISMHRIPSCPIKRKEWIECLSLDKASLRDHHRVCSNQFPHGDQTQKPSLTLGQKKISPMKRNTDRGKRAMKRRTLIVGLRQSAHYHQEKCSLLLQVVGMNTKVNQLY